MGISSAISAITKDNRTKVTKYYTLRKGENRLAKRKTQNVVTSMIQWHPGFATGLDLDLSKYRNEVAHEIEHNLNTKPLSIDILIRKKTGIKIEDNEIGKIFRQYNIVEYKSPDDHMDIDTYYKVYGYACLFKSYGEWVDVIKAEEVTISLFRYAKPKKLFRYFVRNGMFLSNPYPGIYYVEGKNLFPVQIIVTRELDIDKHIWLVALSGKLTKQQVEKILTKASQLSDEREKKLADSVLQVCVAANRKIVEKLKEENRMCQALREIMEPELRQSKEEGKAEAHAEVISIMINALREVGQKEADIKGLIVKKFCMLPEEAEKFMATIN